MDFETTIPCQDCDDWKQRLADNDYEVVGDCQPTANGMCRIKYRHKTAAAGAAALATVAHAAGVPATALMATAAAASGSLVTRVQEQAAKAIVNIFETSQVLGDYSCVTVLANDKGQLTYGRSQTTLASGNLAQLVDRYCSNSGARFGKRLAKWLPALKERDARLNTDAQLHNLLRACADDPVMRDVQDVFFDQFYWMPAVREAARLGVREPLSVAVIYDSHVHGAWGALRDKTNAGGAFKPSEERDWIRRYVQNRRDWLAGSSNPSLPGTVYRMDAFLRLIDHGDWGLPLPLLVRGKEVSSTTLAGMPPGCYDGPEPGTRALAVQAGLLRGLDARLLQLALSDLGRDILADGVFGRTSAQRVAEYQKGQGLPPTGVADAAFIARVLHDADALA